MSARACLATRPRSPIVYLAARTLACRSGAAAIEFALFMIAFAFIILPIGNYGLGVYRQAQVRYAAQAGASYAILHGFVASGITSAITSATSYSSITASPAPTQFYGCPSATGITTMPSATSTCSSGFNAGTYVKSTARATYQAVFAGVWQPSSSVFTSQAVVRIK